MIKFNTLEAKRSKSVLRGHNSTIEINLNQSIDQELKNMVRHFSRAEMKLQSNMFKNLFSNPQEEIKRKLKLRLSDIRNIKPANNSINLPARLKSFLFEATQWLSGAANSTDDLNELDFFKDIKLSESGDIFKGDLKSNLPHGRGL